ncbi:MAG: hypothetical protein AABM29_03905 [Actinomycetota bacterium]
MEGSAGILVLDANERCAVAACESLSRAGYRVGTTSAERLVPGHWSRFSRARYWAPDPRTSSRRFVEHLAAIARRNSFVSVLPGSDASLIAVSSHRELFDDTVELGLPSREVVDACVSKVDLHEKAVEAGLSPPETIVCSNAGEALAAARRLGYPVLLKPRRTVFSRDGDTRQRQSFMAADEAALEARLPEFGLPCLLQRRERGQIVSIGGVMAEDRLQAIAASRYIRTWRPAAGSVSYSQSITAPTHLIDSVDRLLVALGWQGPFELELIESSPGAFAAIDFNPRLYGSLALAVDSGAPLPAIWCDWLLKGKAAQSTARPGVYYRWDDADFRHVVAHISGGRLGSAISVLRPRRHTAHPYLRGGDPRPMAVRYLQALRSGISNHLGRDRGERIRA